MYVVIAYNGPKLHNCANTDNTATNKDLMLIRYYKRSRHSKEDVRLCFGTMQHVIIVKCSTYKV